MRKSGNYYVYPAYFEAGRSRQAGRRVPKKLALNNVDVSQIKRAAQRLNLEFEVKADVRYPASWWSNPGVVLIKKPLDKSKTELLKDLARVIGSLKAAKTK